MKLKFLFIAILALLAAGCMDGGSIDSSITNILGE